MNPADVKECVNCGKAYTRRPDQTRAKFAEAVYCSRACSSRHARARQNAHYAQMRADRMEDVEWIIDSDSPENVAARLGYKNVHALIRMCERWERPDLATKLRRRLEAAA
jgi:hypothetical protein